MPLGIFAASRLAIFGVLFFATRLPGAGKAPRFLTAWDGGWYLLIARTGYPKSLVPAPGQSDHAFSPSTRCWSAGSTPWRAGRWIGRRSR